MIEISIVVPVRNECENIKPFLQTTESVLKKMAKTEIPSRVDPNLLRPADVTLQIPDISKFVLATGWKARYSFEESVEHLLNFWRARV